MSNETNEENIQSLRKRVYKVYITCTTTKQLAVAEKYAWLAIKHMTADPLRFRVYEKEFAIINKFKYRTIDREH